MLGIADDRSIKGLYLTPAQRRHVRQNMDDLLQQRYSPPVPKEFYRVEFHPLFDGQVDGDSGKTTSDGLMEEDEAGADAKGDTPNSRHHIFRIGSLCWCDRDALRDIGLGVIPQRFVIEIVVDVGRKPGTMPMIFADEVGCVCVRCGSENAIPSVEDILDEAIENFERLAM